MKVIFIENGKVYEDLMQDFKKLINESIQETIFELKKRAEHSEQVAWIPGAEAMKILGCKVDKLRELRENGSFKSTQHGRKILYYKPSLYNFLEKHSQ